MDYLTSLAVFVRVADLGSFSAAAEAFGISGTMVGKHVQALERRLGGRLLARTTRRQSLTELGLQFSDRARAILAQVAAADTLGDTLRQQPRGLLRVSAPTALGIERLVPVIADYMAAHPEVEVDLSISDRIVDLADEGFHAAIRTGDPVDPDLVARPLAPYAVTACASPGYLERRGAPDHPDALASHACLGFVHWGPNPMWRFTRGAEVRAVAIAPAFRSDNVLALRQAALAGLGIAVQATVLVGDALATGRLVPVLPGWTLRARPTRLVWPQAMRNSAKLRSFVDFVVRRLG